MRNSILPSLLSLTSGSWYSQNRLPAPEKLQESLRHTGKDKYHFDAAAQTLSYNDPDVKLDLGSVAKGYAVDAAAATLKTFWYYLRLINAGGNIKQLVINPATCPGALPSSTP